MTTKNFTTTNQNLQKYDKSFSLFHPKRTPPLFIMLNEKLNLYMRIIFLIVRVILIQHF